MIQENTSFSLIKAIKMLTRPFNGIVTFAAGRIREGVFGFAMLILSLGLPSALGYILYQFTPHLISSMDDLNWSLVCVVFASAVIGLVTNSTFAHPVLCPETYRAIPLFILALCFLLIAPWAMGVSLFRIINFYTFWPPVIKGSLAVGWAWTILWLSAASMRGSAENGLQQGIIRGSALLTDIIAMQMCNTKRGKNDPGIRIGGCRVPYKDVVNGHVAAIGTTRSGKSLTIFYLMLDTLKRDVVEGLKNGVSGRALIFDYKGDVIPFLTRVAGIASSFIRDLHPQREGAYAWDIAKDVTDESRADQVAAAFIPRPKEGADNSYWNKAAIAIVSGLMLSFKARSGNEWSVIDLVRALRLPKEKVADIIKGTENTRHLAYQFFGRDERFDDVYSTVASEVKNLAPIAALWDEILSEDPTRKIGLSDWTERNEILILGHNQADSEMMKPLNKILFRVLSEKALSEGNSDSSRTYIFLDELSKAGPLPNLHEMLTGGAGKGITVIIGFQDFNGLKEAMGENIAIEIVGMCNTYIALKLLSEETASWVAKRFSEREVVRIVHSENEGTNTGEKSSSHQGTGVSEQISMIANVTASDLRELQRPLPEYGMDAFYSIETAGSYFHHTPPEQIDEDIKPALLANLGRQEKPLRRPKEEKVTSKWSPDDLRRLKLPPDFLEFEEEPGAFFDWNSPVGDARPAQGSKGDL